MRVAASGLHRDFRERTVPEQLCRLADGHLIAHEHPDSGPAQPIERARPDPPDDNGVHGLRPKRLKGITGSMRMIPIPIAQRLYPSRLGIQKRKTGRGPEMSIQQAFFSLIEFNWKNNLHDAPPRIA
jgi:hypothetical protein